MKFLIAVLMLILACIAIYLVTLIPEEAWKWIFLLSVGLPVLLVMGIVWLGDKVTGRKI